MVANDDRRETYRQAYDDWQKHLQALHKVMLDGERLDPVRLKGLLNREARAKEEYDQARARLLGIGGSDDS